ncbi:MAG: response regulator [Candidatus Cryptobacteroides sp.]
MTQDNDLHIILADDSEIFREGVKSILQFEDGIVVDAEASSCNELLKLLESGAKPDVILLDICMEQDGDGLELLGRLNSGHPEIKIIILSHYKEIRYIVKAVQNRVRAYLAKDSSATEIINTIRAVRQGDGVYFGETIPCDLLVKGFGNSDNILKAKPYELSSRELEILKMLACGLSVKDISKVLEINMTTVESYKERIKNKLGVNTIMEAVVFAVKCELF